GADFAAHDVAVAVGVKGIEVDAAAHAAAGPGAGRIGVAARGLAGLGEARLRGVELGAADPAVAVGIHALDAGAERAAVALGVARVAGLAVGARVAGGGIGRGGGGGRLGGGKAGGAEGGRGGKGGEEQGVALHGVSLSAAGVLQLTRSTRGPGAGCPGRRVRSAAVRVAADATRRSILPAWTAGPTTRRRPAVAEAAAMRLFHTAGHPCGYWPDRTARDLVLDPGDPRLPDAYARALAWGFRRSGDLVR